MYIDSMLMTVKQIAQKYGKVERVVVVAVARLSLKPDYTRAHAGKIARYYDTAAQDAIGEYIRLSRNEKLARLPPRPRKAPLPRVIPREEWTYRTIARKIGGTKRGVRTLLAIHGYPTMAEFIATTHTFDDVKKWYAELPGDTPYLKGRSLFKLGLKTKQYTLCTHEKLHAAQSCIIKKYDSEIWATRVQGAEYLGYNDTTTYALYKGAGLRFIKDHAVLLYNWEDLRTLKANLLTKKGNVSNLAETFKNRLLAENVDFTMEKTFPDLLDKRPLRFDFCIPDRRILVEVQGTQHFTEGFAGTQKVSLDEIQRRDIMKREYANENGWDLIWVSALHDIGDAMQYIIGGTVKGEWAPELVRDYGACALSHYDGDAPRFCWLHRGHFPYDRAGMILKRIHRSYWHAAIKGHFSPYLTWSCKKSAFYSLVENRQKYHPSLSNNPGAIPTLSMLVAGFGISKICPPVSFFSPTYGEALIKEFVQTNAIVDPFSGFSGRALAAHLSGKSYIGYDISANRVLEAQSVIDHYHMKNVCISVQDILKSEFAEYSDTTLLTCPPYGDKEKWDGGAVVENEDYWIGQALSKYGCTRYIFVVGHTERYARFEVSVGRGYAHKFYAQGTRMVLVIDRSVRDSLVSHV